MTFIEVILDEARAEIRKHPANATLDDGVA